MTLNAELNQKARAILTRELGPVDYARFIQQYDVGTGDYIPISNPQCPFHSSPHITRCSKCPPINPMSVI